MISMRCAQLWRRRPLVAWMIAVLSLSTATPSRGQDGRRDWSPDGLRIAFESSRDEHREISWSLWPFVGVAFAGDLDQRAHGIGFALALQWTSHLDLEGELGYLPDLTDHPDSSALLLSGDAVYHVLASHRSLVPYGAIGGTLARLDTGTRERRKTATEVAVNIGGGVKVRVTDSVWLRGDLRFIHIDNAPNFWRSYGAMSFGWP